MDFRPIKLSPADEKRFLRWYRKRVGFKELNPNIDQPTVNYDYRQHWIKNILKQVGMPPVPSVPSEEDLLKQKNKLRKTKF